MPAGQRAGSSTGMCIYDFLLDVSMTNDFVTGIYIPLSAGCLHHERLHLEQGLLPTRLVISHSTTNGCFESVFSSPHSSQHHPPVQAATGEGADWEYCSRKRAGRVTASARTLPAALPNEAQQGREDLERTLCTLPEGRKA